MLTRGRDAQAYPPGSSGLLAGGGYLAFTGYGVIDPSVIRISDTGLASAADSIGHYNYRTVIVFVRNGDSVGWIELKVTHASGK